MGKFWYLVGYSLKKKIKSKAFIISNILIAILLILVINLPNIIKSFGGDFDDQEQYLVYNDTSKDIKKYLVDFETEELSFEFSDDKFGEDNVSNDLVDNQCVIYIYYGSDGYMDAKIYANDISLTKQTYIVQSLNSVKVKLWEENASEEAREQVKEYLAEVDTEIILEDDSADSVQRRLLGTVASIILVPVFILIVFIMSFVGADILEEKSSRSIEYIISNVEPSKHFLSKIVGAVLFILIQMCVMILAGLLGLLISIPFSSGDLGTTTSFIDTGNATMNLALDNIISMIPGMIGMTILFIIAGFLFYLVLMAICSSMATSMEDYQQFQTPVMLVLLVGFYTALFGSMTAQGSTFIKIMAYIPFFSPLIAPVLFINGTFGVLEAFISLGILVVFDILIIKFGMPLYKVSILDYSQGKFFKKLISIIKKSKYSD